MAGFLGAMAGGAAVTIVIKAIDNYSKQFNKLDKSVKKQQTGFKKLTGFLKSSGIGYTVLATAAVGFGIKAVKAGIKAERAMAQFDLTLGDTAETMLTDMRRASNGMVSDFELVDNANKALALGISKSKIPQLLAAATARAKVFGRTAGEAFNDLAIGIGRQSRMILDNLGIILDLDKTYGDYAETVGKTVEQLTDYDRKMALTNSIIESSKDLMIAQIFLQETMDEKLQKLTSSWDNFWQSIGSGLINMNNFMNGTTGANDALAATFDRLLDLEGAFEDTGNAILNIGNELRESNTRAKSLLDSLRDIKNVSLAGEAAKNLKVTKAEIKVDEERLAVMNATTKEERDNAQFRLDKAEGNLKRLDLESKIEFANTKLLTQANADKFIAEQTNVELTQKAYGDLANDKMTAYISELNNIETLTNKQNEFIQAIKDSGIISDEIFNTLKDPSYKNEEDAIQAVINKTNDLINVYKKAAEARSGIGVGSFSNILSEELAKRGVSKKSKAGSDLMDKFSGGSGSVNWEDIINPKPFSFSSVGDAIIRPNGDVIETDPKDTLIATKSGIGGGVTLIVQGNLIGMGAEEISRALSDELGDKLSL